MVRQALVKFLVWMILSVAFCAPCLAASPAAPPSKTAWDGLPPDDVPLVARRTPTPPVLDGRPDEAVWREAAWRDDFKDMVDGTKPHLRTETALLWDDEALYVAARMEDPRLEAHIVERDGMVYRDPDFEVFIAGPNAYWEIEVNARNTLYDVFWIWRDALDAAHGFSPEIWHLQRRILPLKGIGEHVHPRGERLGFIDEDMPGLEVKAALDGTCNDNSDTDTGWTLEMRIPWKALDKLAQGRALPPAPGETWSLNLSRFANRDAAGNALPPLRPAGWTLRQHGVFDSHVPERWVPVTFTEHPDASGHPDTLTGHPDIISKPPNVTGHPDATGHPNAFSKTPKATGHANTTEHPVTFSGHPNAFTEHQNTTLGHPDALPSEAFLRDYLLGDLSAADKLTLGKRVAPFVADHAARTARAIREAPWSARLTPELICRTILPHRVSGEHLENWRAPLQEQFAPLVRDAKSPTEAALRLRERLNKLVVPGDSMPWSLGPLGLLAAGSGRCEELAILFVCAARSVGLPARVAYVPAWRGADGNHMWVEFWDGDWIALSPEQTAAPEAGWFLPLAAQAASITALARGHADDGLKPEAHRLGRSPSGVTLIDRTSHYARTGKVRVHAFDAQGQPVEALVRAYVFNRARPRSVMARRGSQVELNLGSGGYLFSVSYQDNTALRQDNTTLRQDNTVLRHNKTVLLAVSIESGKETSLQVNFDGTENSAVVEIDENAGYLPPVHAPQTGLPSAAPLPLPSPKYGLPLSDAVYADSVLLGQELAHADFAWRHFWGKAASSPSLAPLYDMAASSRIADEPFSHWRLKLAALVRPCVVQGKPALTAGRIAAWLNATWPTPCDASGALNGEIPLAAWVDRLHALHNPNHSPGNLPDAQVPLHPDQQHWVFVAVAALRTAGIPARPATLYDSTQEEWIWAEYFDGTAWNILLPNLSPDSEKKLRALQKGKRNPIQLAIPTDLSTGRPIALAKDGQGKSWSICQMSPSGVFYPLEQSADKMANPAAGPCFLIQGERDPATGLARWSLRPLESTTAK